MKRGIQLASPYHDKDGDQESQGKLTWNVLCIQLIIMIIPDMIKHKFNFSPKIDIFLSLKLINIEGIKNKTEIAGAERSKKTPNLK